MKNLKGKRFGLLAAVRATERRSNGCVVWECLCDCGNTTYVSISNLQTKHTRSCGCMVGGKRKHGHTINNDWSTEYYAWWNMHARCRYPCVKSYKWYGAKGISVCDKWSGPNGFANFLKDMGSRPQGYSVSRIDHQKDYTPDNTKWEDAKENSRESAFRRWAS